MVLRVHFNARIREFYINHDDVNEIESDSFYCIGRLGYCIGRLGYDMRLKPEQEAALLSFPVGVFVSLPTGYGKSLCYAALPAAFDSLRNTFIICMPSKSIVLIVSPLIALMKDHVATLSAKGLSVGCIRQESSDSERAMALSGQYQL